MADQRATVSTWRDRFSTKGRKGKASSDAHKTSLETPEAASGVVEVTNTLQSTVSDGQETSSSVQVPPCWNDLLNWISCAWFLRTAF